jgi:hypothetical protein
MEGPFFSVDGHDVTWFASRQRAEHYLEAYDVGTYRFFAKDGTELRVKPDWATYRVVVTDESLGKFADELAEALRGALQALPPRYRQFDEDRIRSAPLAELVDAMTRSVESS